MFLRLVLPAALAATILGLPGHSAQAVETDFPAGYEGYHTLAEMDAELDAAVAAFGSGSGAIVKRTQIGHSYEGRPIWAIKISDNVATDEDEPEVLSVHMVHAREHITLEMGLYMIRLLTENYGQPGPLGERVTDIVNSREIWILPMMNPDGAEYNISGGTFHGWRKNRQLNPGSDAIGIDLNRNFGFMWNCCGGSGGNPGSARYRGQYPWEGAENVVLRDFILGRRVAGQQQIRAVFNWHSYGEFVMWPFGYTREDVPETMTVDDHTALVALGTNIAALNGYKPKQGSDSYIYDGDFIAWAYGDQRIFSYTFEMYPKWGANAGGFKPDDEVLERETTRNTDAVLYFMEQADCVYRPAGLERTHCGPLYEDFEVDRGWTFGSAADGGFERALPQASRTSAGWKQRANVANGRAAIVTGPSAGAGPEDEDLDGASFALSPVVTVPAGGSWRVRFKFTFAHDLSATADDFLSLSVVEGSTATQLWRANGRAFERNARWRKKAFSLNAWRGKTIQLRFDVADGGADNLVEAAIDDVRVFRAP